VEEKVKLETVRNTVRIGVEHDRNVVVVPENIDRGAQLRHVYELQGGDTTVLMISDIRSTEDHSKEGVIEDNMVLQERLYRDLKPRQAMLKFRLPYSKVGITTYLAGDLKYGVYCPHASHGTK
jgi:hypothetical protein